MAEAKSRRDLSPRPRPRPRPDEGDMASDDDLTFPRDEGSDVPRTERPEPPARTEAPPRPDAPPRPEPRPEPRAERPDAPPRREASPEEEFPGFDEEVNNRYEEIKRGSTHISELQQMTMPQLLKVAKEEGL